MWMKISNYKHSSIFLLLAFFFVFFFSCCASLKRKNNSDAALNQDTVNDTSLTIENAEISSINNQTIQSFYDSMLYDVCSEFFENGIKEDALPDWLKKLPEDDAYFYVVGISKKLTSEQRSRESALLDAMNNLYEAGNTFLPEGEKPIVNGYTHISTFTQEVKNKEKAKTAYITTVLVRVPKKRIMGDL